MMVATDHSAWHFACWLHVAFLAAAMRPTVPLPRRLPVQRAFMEANELPFKPLGWGRGSV